MDTKIGVLFVKYTQFSTVKLLYPDNGSKICTPLTPIYITGSNVSIIHHLELSLDPDFIMSDYGYDNW